MWKILPEHFVKPPNFLDDFTKALVIVIFNTVEEVKAIALYHVELENIFILLNYPEPSNICN